MRVGITIVSEGVIDRLDIVLNSYTDTTIKQLHLQISIQLGRLQSLLNLRHKNLHIIIFEHSNSLKLVEFHYFT